MLYRSCIQYSPIKIVLCEYYNAIIPKQLDCLISIIGIECKLIAVAVTIFAIDYIIPIWIYIIVGSESW